MKQIWETLKRTVAERSELGAELEETDLSPWALCTLVALARHLVRQEWVADVVRDRLGGDPALIARAGGFGHPEHIEQDGSVPGLPGWKYFFHGCGCCLSEPSSGTSIDVDFYEDGRSDGIDPYFYANYLESLRHPEPVEASIIRLHPSFRTVSVSIEELVEQGFLSKGPVRCTTETRAHAALLRTIGERWTREELASSQDMLVRRRAWLLRRDGANTDGLLLRAFAETSPPDLAKHLIQALEATSFTTRTSTAIDLIAQANDPSYSPALWALFCRLDPAGESPQPFLWARCSELLLRHKFAVDGVVAKLGDAGGTEIAEAALLALEFAPPLCRPLLRKALRSDVPLNRGIAAASLALIDQAWALDELYALLSESIDESATSECRAALRSLGDPRGLCAVWEGRQIEAAPLSDGPLMTIDQLVLRSTDERVRADIERLRERVQRLTRIAPS
jgi:hypothetical protein